ncbi:acyltransferase, partial [Candidatus Parcubacteria bacterium]
TIDRMSNGKQHDDSNKNASDKFGAIQIVSKESGISSSSWHISPRPSFSYIPYLNGLRAIAVLIVMGRHLGFSEYFPGGFGVTIFFFLSGFLITRLLLAEIETKSKIHLPNFYIRRFFRLFPALLIMLIVTGLVNRFVLNFEVGFPDVAASILYYMNYYAAYLHACDQAWGVGGWEVLWSLAVEEHFYLLFPIVLLLREDLRIKATFFLIIIPIGMRYFYYFLMPDAAFYIFRATETRIDSLLWGCLLSLVLSSNKGRKFIEEHFFSSYLFWVSVIFLLLIFLIRDVEFQSTIKFSLQGALLFIVFIQLLFTNHHHTVKAILESALMRWIGKISYSLYLWHISCHVVVSHVGGVSGIQASLISLALSLVVAHLSYHFIEMPVVQLRKRYGAHVKA